MDSSQEQILTDLIVANLYGCGNPADFQQLKQMLETDPEAVELYVEYAMQYSALMQPGKLTIQELPQEPSSPLLDTDLWKAFSEYEKTAPRIQLPEEKASRELLQKVIYPPREKRKQSKLSIFTLTVSAAAILFVVLFLKFAPEKPYRIEVATLVDQINVTWTDSRHCFQNGDRLWTNRKPIGVDQGILEFHYDDGVSVVVEGPAKFTIERSGIFMDYGRLYSHVPPSGLGFSIETPTARIVDMGTEFGVQADVNGSAELHVLKGKVQLFAGGSGNAKSCRTLEANQAVRYDSDSNILTAIDIQEHAFVRQVDSESELIWRGEAVCLADIVGGGNGFSAGKPHMGIDPVSGRMQGEAMGMQMAPNDFRPVPSHACIDGVFIPNGRTEQIISSRGHLFRECPPTEGACFNKITYLQQSLNSRGDGEGFLGRPIVTMHANMGITYDLEAIRRLLPEAMNIVRFRSQLGIENEAPRHETSNADFWILIDGQLRYQKEQVKAGELYSVDFELNEADQFLTLVITDGRDPAERVVEGASVSPIDCDWGVFIHPVLVIE